MTIKFSDLAMLAQQSRRDNGYQGGVVVFFQGKEAGWMNELRDPQHWIPGCIAVNEDDRMWLATGGNERDGARTWQPLSSDGTIDQNGGLVRTSDNSGQRQARLRLVQ